MKIGRSKLYMENFLEKITLIIPSLSPDEHLIKYVNQLIQYGFINIIVINDGSEAKYEEIFETLNKYKQVVVLKHAVNQGKGRALKIAFHYYLNEIINKNNSIGVVTADADGQHAPEDTYEVAKTLYRCREFLILGTRDFNEEIVPFKSRYGNKITSLMFKILFGGDTIHDTQTGLRGIPNNQIIDYLSLEGERFEYEINMLIKARKKYLIKEVKIKTLYANGNRETHFNAVKDSLKIYSIMFRQFITFVVSSISSLIVDLLLFNLFLTIIRSYFDISLSIILSTIFARIISSLFNYTLNKNIVFETSKKNMIVYYYMLCIIQMFCSAALTSILNSTFPINVNIVKVIVDFFLFCISFQIQSKIIFK